MPQLPLYRRLMKDAEKEMLADALSRHDQHRLSAALYLEMHPVSFQRKLQQHALNQPDRA